MRLTGSREAPQDDKRLIALLLTGLTDEAIARQLGIGYRTAQRRIDELMARLGAHTRFQAGVQAARSNTSGVWQRLHEVLLDRLRAADALDLSRAAVDSSQIRAFKRGAQNGPSPVDRGRAGSKHHLITEATGIPLAVILTGANRNDVTQLRPLLDAVPKVRGKRGRPRQRPDVVLADRGYDHDKYRCLVRELQTRLLIARRGTAHGSGLGKQRWVVEQTFALLHAFRRLRIRWEVRADIHEAFLKLACVLICWRRLTSLR
ncbi:IS5 family transposase [Nonomuraea sp. NPDC001831]|uniref:IS5 family transposase n=1 Tax=Nonomuraea sp. NPDC001831 TaxID=3364340 RepID=UPI0036AE0F75